MKARITKTNKKRLISLIMTISLLLSLFAMVATALDEDYSGADTFGDVYVANTDDASDTGSSEPEYNASPVEEAEVVEPEYEATPEEDTEINEEVHTEDEAYTESYTYYVYDEEDEYAEHDSITILVVERLDGDVDVTVLPYGTDHAYNVEEDEDGNLEVVITFPPTTEGDIEDENVRVPSDWDFDIESDVCGYTTVTVLAFVPLSDTFTATPDFSWENLRTMISDLSGPDTIILPYDITSTGAFITVPTGRVVTITGDATLYRSSEGRHFAVQGGELTLAGNIALTRTVDVVGYTGGVAVSGVGILTLNGATIIGNKANNGAGVNLNGGGTFILNDGLIYGNTGNNGGGVRATGSAANIIISGGTIASNFSTNSGGGIMVLNGAGLTITAGYIINNQAAVHGGAIHIQDNAANNNFGTSYMTSYPLYIRGSSVTITGNTTRLSYRQSPPPGPPGVPSRPESSPPPNVSGQISFSHINLTSAMHANTQRTNQVLDFTDVNIEGVVQQIVGSPITGASGRITFHPDGRYIEHYLPNGGGLGIAGLVSSNRNDCPNSPIVLQSFRPYRFDENGNLVSQPLYLTMTSGDTVRFPLNGIAEVRPDGSFRIELPEGGRSVLGPNGYTITTPEGGNYIKLPCGTEVYVPAGGTVEYTPPGNWRLYDADGYLIDGSDFVSSEEPGHPWTPNTTGSIVRGILINIWGETNLSQGQGLLRANGVTGVEIPQVLFDIVEADVPGWTAWFMQHRVWGPALPVSQVVTPMSAAVALTQNSLDWNHTNRLIDLDHFFSYLEAIINRAVYRFEVTGQLGYLAGIEQGIVDVVIGFAVESRNWGQITGDLAGPFSRILQYVLAPVEHEVTFLLNDGTTVVHATVTVVYGSTVTPPAIPTRADHAFRNWYTNAAATTAFSFGTPITSDVTLHAGWTTGESPEPLQQVFFWLNDGSDNLHYVAHVVSGNTVTPPSVPSRTDHTFRGWYTTSATATTFNFSTVVNNTVNVYAGWTDGEPTGPIQQVFFWLNDGSGNLHHVAHVAGGSTVSAPAVPTRDGFWAFRNWYTSAAATTTFNFATAINNTINVYAGWEILEPGAPWTPNTARTIVRGVLINIWGETNLSDGPGLLRANNVIGVEIPQVLIDIVDTEGWEAWFMEHRVWGPGVQASQLATPMNAAVAFSASNLEWNHPNRVTDLDHFFSYLEAIINRAVYRFEATGQLGYLAGIEAGITDTVIGFAV
ncbi:MAG: InlB B-repeat-containing protein, partial [Oscillospiraceae bacterium]|nr:InlB B-repeat-containing protein [Oscillospiraceae bacterium]